MSSSRLEAVLRAGQQQQRPERERREREREEREREERERGYDRTRDPRRDIDEFIQAGMPS